MMMSDAWSHARIWDEFFERDDMHSTCRTTSSWPRRTPDSASSGTGVRTREWKVEHGVVRSAMLNTALLQVTVEHRSLEDVAFRR